MTVELYVAVFVSFVLGAWFGRWHEQNTLRRRNSARAKKSANTKRLRRLAAQDTNAALRVVPMGEHAYYVNADGSVWSKEAVDPVTWTPAVGNDV